MARILNVNFDIYSKFIDKSFLQNFINKNKLKIGDIVGIIKDDLKNSFIIDNNYEANYNCRTNDKFVISQEISNCISNPVLHYNEIKFLIKNIELNTEHSCFKILLDFNIFDNILIKFDYDYKNKLHFINQDGVNLYYNVKKLTKKDNVLIFLLMNFTKKYTLVKKKIKIPKNKLNLYIESNIKSMILYWELISFSQNEIDKDTIEVSIEIKLPICEIDLFNKKYDINNLKEDKFII